MFFRRVTIGSPSTLATFKESGSVAFYLLCGIPLIFTFTVFSIDISRYYLLRQTTQQQADRLAFEAARYLPDRERASSTLFRALSKLDAIQVVRETDGSPSVVVESDTVSLRLRSRITPMLASFLPHPAIQDIEFVVEEYSAVQMRPSDLILLLSDSAQLAPELAPWGAEQVWPASPVLQTLHFACGSDGGPCGTLNAQQQRLVTQRCYNPRYSAIKQVVIDLYQLYSLSARNRVGVLATPGSSPTQGYQVLGGTFSTLALNGAQLWSNWQHRDLGYSDDLCIYLSDTSLLQHNPYAVVSAKPKQCAAFVGSIPNTYLPHGSVQGCFLATSSVEERVWWHAARDTALKNDDFANSLEESIRIFASSQEISLERGRFSQRTNRIVVAVLDTVPVLSRQIVERLAEHGIDLYLFVHLGAEGTTTLVGGAGGAQSARSKWLKRHSHISLATTTSNAELREAISEMLLTAHREVVVRS